MATISDLFAAADQSLFNRVLANDLHVLQPLLSDNFSYNLCYLIKPTVTTWRHDRHNKENYMC